VTVFTVHEPPNAPQSLIDHAEKLRFVNEGFSWGAALFPPFWLAARGEWIALAAYLAAATVVGTILAALGAEAAWVTLIFLAANVVLGFEAGELERWSLARGGWREIGLVSGRTRGECERRFFEGWLSQAPGTAAAVLEPVLPTPPRWQLPQWELPRWPGWRALLGIGP
jgi:hypothetical protein